VRADVSNTNRTEALPVPLPPLNLAQWTFENSIYDLKDTHPDIYLGHKVTCQVKLLRGTNPVSGVDIDFTSINGKLSYHTGKATTDANGIATIYVTPENARLTELGVVASYKNFSVPLEKRIGGTNEPIRWVSSAPVIAEPESHIIILDADNDGVENIETLDDSGEAELNIPGAVEGDGFLSVPYVTQTPLKITGIPNHKYTVRYSDNLSTLKTIYFPFDIITPSDTTFDIINNLPAHTQGTVSASHKEGNGSMYTTEAISVNDHNNWSLSHQTYISFYLKPQSITNAILIEKPDEYKLEMLDNGTVKFTVWGEDADENEVTHEVTSDASTSMTAGKWTYVKVFFSNQQITISVGEDETHRHTAHTEFSPITVDNTNSNVTIADGFSGNIDALCYAVHNPALAAAKILGANPDGTVMTDSLGVAVVYVQAKNLSVTLHDYEPVDIEIEVFGSEGFVAKLKGLKKKVWGNFVNVGASLGRALIGGSEAGFERKKNPVLWGIQWATEFIPFVSDIRTLVLEGYKAATGCDKVSPMNVGFAITGLVVDIFTLGAGSLVTKPAITGAKLALKPLLKELAVNQAVGFTFTTTIEHVMQKLNEELAKETDEDPNTNAAQWALSAMNFMEKMKNNMKDANNDLTEIFNLVFQSTHDFFFWMNFNAEEVGQGNPNAFVDFFSKVKLAITE